MSKVYVVVDEFYGTIDDVNVYKNKPKNLKTNTLSCSVCGITEDESPDSRPNEIKLYYKNFKENEWMEFFILILGILLYVLDSAQEEDKDE